MCCKHCLIFLCFTAICAVEHRITWTNGLLLLKNFCRICATSDFVVDAVTEHISSTQNKLGNETVKNQHRQTRCKKCAASERSTSSGHRWVDKRSVSTDGQAVEAGRSQEHVYDKSSNQFHRRRGFGTWSSLALLAASACHRFSHCTDRHITQSPGPTHHPITSTCPGPCGLPAHKPHQQRHVTLHVTQHGWPATRFIFRLISLQLSQAGPWLKTTPSGIARVGHFTSQMCFLSSKQQRWCIYDCIRHCNTAHIKVYDTEHNELSTTTDSGNMHQLTVSTIFTVRNIGNFLSIRQAV